MSAIDEGRLSTHKICNEVCKVKRTSLYRLRVDRVSGLIKGYNREQSRNMNEMNMILQDLRVS